MSQITEAPSCSWGAARCASRVRGLAELSLAALFPSAFTPSARSRSGRVVPAFPFLKLAAGSRCTTASGGTFIAFRAPSARTGAGVVHACVLFILRGSVFATPDNGSGASRGVGNSLRKIRNANR